MHDEIKDLQRHFIDCAEVLVNVGGNKSFAQVSLYYLIRSDIT